jgi:hypothetical protein
VNPRLTLDGLNHPILAWSELEHYRWSRDKERLRAVWEPLLRFYRALQEYLRQGNGLFVTDWASMDNSPRNEFLDGGGTGVDISSEMVLMARQLADISGILGMREEAALLRQEAEVLAALINRLMWDDAKGFYVDLMRDGRPSPVRTVAAYWTLLAGVATPERARRLADELSNPVTFGRLNPVPTCAGDEPGFKAHGGYWRGAVWAPTNTMVIRGLEKYGYGELAREIALKHLALVADVYSQTGTIWENYAPDLTEPGTIFAGLRVRKDFVGWSGIGPILYLLEYAIGLRASAPDNRLTWIIGSESRCGCERFRFAGHVVSLVAEKAGAAGTRLVRISSDGEFRLSVSWRGRTKESAVRPGESELVV